jgi:hypothetical protein
LKTSVSACCTIVQARSPYRFQHNNLKLLILLLRRSMPPGQFLPHVPRSNSAVFERILLFGQRSLHSSSRPRCLLQSFLRHFQHECPRSAHPVFRNRNSCSRRWALHRALHCRVCKPLTTISKLQFAKFVPSKYRARLSCLTCFCHLVTVIQF